MPKRFQKMAPSSTPRFCNLGREWKYDDVTMMHWCSIVRRVPGSTLALVHGIEKLGREPLLRIANVTENISRFFVEQWLAVRPQARCVCTNRSHTASWTRRAWSFCRASAGTSTSNKAQSCATW